MVKNKRIAIIPARGGSKRIPGKNIIDFAGKPMIAWSIEAARDSALFDSIVVSTDSEDIASVAKQYGAEVPALRKTAADDFTPVSEATLHTILQLEENGRYYDEVVQLFAVCPLRNADDIKNAYHFFIHKQASFLVSCYRYAWMNPWWAVTLNHENKPTWIFDKEKKRSQDLPPLFSPTGAIWIAKVESLKRDKTFYGQEHIFWEMDWKRALDIDNVEDIKLGLALRNVGN